MSRSSRRILLFWCAAFPFSFNPAVAAEGTWENVYFDGSRIGSVHTTTAPGENAGLATLRTNQELKLTFRRYQDKVELRMDQGSEETQDGKILSVFMRQYQGEAQRLELVGEVQNDGSMRVTVDRGRIERTIPWSKDVMSVRRMEQFFRDRKLQAGDRFSIKVYEPIYNTVVTLQVEVRDQEEVIIEGAKLRVHRVEMTPEKLNSANGPIQLPSRIWWLDQAGVPVRKQYELAGVGNIILVRAGEKEAREPVANPARSPDIGINSLLPLDRRIVNPHRTRSVKFRITLKDAVDPSTALVQDEHQDITRIVGQVVEVVVHPVLDPAARPNAARPGPEYTDSCPFLDSDNREVQRLAKLAAADEQDAWKRARRIESWVRWNLTRDNSAPLVSAGAIASQPRGDCRHHAFLTAAMCRAQGIPSRTAIGVVYVEKDRRPHLGFHMWTEVWIEGTWRGLDSTLGQGRIGATHLKITDHHWQGVRSLTPLLPLVQLVGKMSIEVVEVLQD